MATTLKLIGLFLLLALLSDMKTAALVLACSLAAGVVALMLLHASGVPSSAPQSEAWRALREYRRAHGTWALLKRAVMPWRTS